MKLFISYTLARISTGKATHASFSTLRTQGEWVIAWAIDTFYLERRPSEGAFFVGPESFNVRHRVDVVKTFAIYHCWWLTQPAFSFQTDKSYRDQLPTSCSQLAVEAVAFQLSSDFGPRQLVLAASNSPPNQYLKCCLSEELAQT